ncbi:hypothetical protein CP985_08870 [Malaciobacter mytili LMG 24559]|uniref:Haemolysin-type calcium binding-related domain-containing protein n=1 Tax=Malaciobacter mytili LMG 24559 TaxID=1032238 RepID=A0AAX2AEB0_9BACT|nr:hypothetical protein [Malaciobacter mytili]AXH15368.1 hypothetical protein AMYT_1797 [Malaciobacter mytili LMG 24559]RXK15352.1 hypothetical protein CP985_08870 [Malaciobacter mytili LMG 24559]
MDTSNDDVISTSLTRVRTGNDIVTGGEGNDTYIFERWDDRDTIFDSSGNDKILFGNTVKHENIIFHWNDNDLIINNSWDRIIVKNQKISENRIERFELSNGNYLTNSDIEVLIQNMTSFANNNGIDITNRREVTNNSELINLVSNTWQVA